MPTPDAVAPPTAPNNAVRTTTTIFTIAFQFFNIAYLLSFLNGSTSRFRSLLLVLWCVTSWLIRVAGRWLIGRWCWGVAALSLGLRRVDCVLWCLLYGATANERLLALTVRVGLHLRLEQHVQTLDVLAGTEV